MFDEVASEEYDAPLMVAPNVEPETESDSYIRCMSYNALVTGKLMVPDTEVAAPEYAVKYVSTREAPSTNALNFSVTEKANVCAPTDVGLKVPL